MTGGPRYEIQELGPSTWGTFAELVERNNGVYGGCWCIGYHPECGQRGIDHRAVKEERTWPPGREARLDREPHRRAGLGKSLGWGRRMFAGRSHG